MIVLDERHLKRILRKYVDYYHSCRTHLSLEKDAPEPRRVESRVEEQYKKSIEDLNEAVEVLQERMRLLSLGLDYRRYVTFRQLTPEVWHVSVRPSRRTDKPPNITLEQLQFCIGFVIDTALQLQVAEGNIGHPADGTEEE